MLNKYDGYTVGPKLRQLRKDKKLSVYQVSELTGLSNSSINQIEQGGRDLSMNGLYLLMDAYQCDANKLLNMEETDTKGYLWKTIINALNVEATIQREFQSN